MVADIVLDSGRVGLVFATLLLRNAALHHRTNSKLRDVFLAART
jgi:hypothetical protein